MTTQIMTHDVHGYLYPMMVWHSGYIYGI
jgi:hypothetical protein